MLVQRKVTYLEIDALQKKLADSSSPTQPTRLLLLSEVTPVVTLGRRTASSDLSPQLPLPILALDRGGLATWHGPGQWLAFPVAPLASLVGDSRGVKRLGLLLLQAAQATAQAWGVQCEIREGAHLGLWRTDPGYEGKLTSIGIALRKGVVQHGIALNVRLPSGAFDQIRPCGLDLPPSDLCCKGRPPPAVDLVGVTLKQELLKRFPIFGELDESKQPPLYTNQIRNNETVGA